MTTCGLKWCFWVKMRKNLEVRFFGKNVFVFKIRLGSSLAPCPRLALCASLAPGGPDSRVPRTHVVWSHQTYLLQMREPEGRI